MDTFSEKKHSHIHFIGIGGISMSGLAEILLHKEYKISGSDINLSDTVKHLMQLGADVSIGQREENITDDIDLVVYTAAVKPTNPELIAAQNKGLRIIDRAQLLGTIMREFKFSVAVSGTHGKTTTSSMVSEILMAADADPTISIGGILPSINGNIKIGHSEYFVAEACEYFESFLKFNPFIGVILNVEADHLDYFKDIDHIRRSFHNFAKRIPDDGCLVINKTIDKLDDLIKDLHCNIVTYGSDDANWKAENIIHEPTGQNSFDAIYNNKKICRISLNIPGDHNISNALAACAAAYSLGIDPNDIVKGLSVFKGTKRRFQYKGEFNGVNIIDDYAHHPTEVKATLAAAKNVKHSNLWVVFQPHTFSRTKSFLNEFAQSFDNADKIIIARIFAAREKDLGEISGADLARELKAIGKDAVYFDEFSQIEDYILTNCVKGDLLITMGAGDVYLIGDNILSK